MNIKALNEKFIGQSKTDIRIVADNGVASRQSFMQSEDLQYKNHCGYKVRKTHCTLYHAPARKEHKVKTYKIYGQN